MNTRTGTHTGSILRRTKKSLFILLLFLGWHLQVAGQLVEISAQNKALNLVLLEMARDYGVQVSFNDELLSQYRVSRKQRFEDPEEAIAILIQDFPLSYKKIGEVFTIYFTPVEEQPARYRLRGQVIDKKNGETLPFSHVIINNTGLISDFTGNFSFVSTDSLFRVRISYLGYYIKDTTLKAGETHVLGLTPSVIGLQEVVVEGSMLERSGQIGQEAGVIRLNHKIAYRIPGNGDNAVFNFLRLQPGILAAGERSSELIIWGSYSGQSKILFDGFTVFGLKNFNDNISFVNPYMAKDIKVLKGGYASVYDNRVGGIVDISGINGSTRKPSLNLNINNMTLNGMASVPLSARSSLTFAYRQTYYQLYDQNNLNFINSVKNPDKFDFNIFPDYLFRDMNLKLAGSTRGGDQYFISLYNGRDEFAYEVDQETNVFTLYQDVEEKNWQRGGSAFYGKNWKNGTSSHFAADLSGLDRELYENLDVTRKVGQGGGGLPLAREVLYSNDILEFNFRNSNRVPLTEKQLLEFGWNFTYESTNFVEDSLDLNLQNTSGRSDRLGLFVQDEIRPAGWFSIRPGIRLDYPFQLDRVYVQPRVQLELDLAERWSLNAAAGMYRQFISETSVMDELGNINYFWAISDNRDVPVLRSNHFLGGLTFSHKGFTIGTEAYYKTTTGISRTVYLWKEDIQIVYQGDARMYGMDLLVKQYFRKHEAWASYSISRTEEYFPYMSEEVEYRAAPQDQRHEVKGALLLNFNPFFFSANYVYGSGFREPGSLFEETEEGERYPYNRFDVAFIYRLSRKSYHIEVGISIMNVLDHENIKYSNVVRIPSSQTTSVTINAEAVPFTPTLYLNMAF